MPETDGLGAIHLGGAEALDFLSARGANAVVSMPVEFGAFAGAVAGLGMFWLLVNKPPF